MRFAWLIGTLIVLAAPILFIPGETDASKKDVIQVDLSIDFREKDEGHVVFSMGNIVPVGLEEVDIVPIRTDPYKNDNMDHLLDSFRYNNKDNISYFRMILNCHGELELDNTKFMLRVERNYFSFLMETDFKYQTDGIDAEYTYLNVVKGIDNYITRIKGESLIDFNLRKLSELNKIRSHLDVDVGSGLSISTTSGFSGHSRGLSGESLSETIGTSTLTGGTNELKVYDHILLSPGFSLFATLFYILVGFSLLGFIWWRNRFRGPGLILPIITLLFSLVVIFNYFTPSVNFHSLGAASIWIWGSMFLGLVMASYHVNPKPKFRGYDEEVKNQPSLKMPKVVYVDRQVLVEKRIRMSEEEALDPYEVLEVSKRDTFEEIEKTYRSRIKEYHPDKFTRTPKRIHDAARKE
ncbi:MAG: DnaJ domain-containing protein, partial [Candidatus Thermoplasmatota archaeon]|nr:DnaJ domain-containing protein [Candidatus Thermoplasmatota archaeon]